MKRGEQLKIPAAGQQVLHHIFGAVNHVTGEIIWTDAPKKNTNSFVEFLDHFQASIDTSTPTLLFLDNASYHTSRDAEAALAILEENNIVACFLPPYCSDLNPIEDFWRYLKSYACPNKLFDSISALVASVSQCLHNQNNFASPDRFNF